MKPKEEENKREVHALRRALYEEIYKIQYFESLTENYSVGNSVLGIATPNKIYELNTSKIGLLRVLLKLIFINLSDSNGGW